jgi:hypothetical protein
MPKIVDAKKIADRIITKHKQAVTAARSGEQSDTWKRVDEGMTCMAEVFRISGQILRLFTIRLFMSALRAVHAGITTFFMEMGRDLDL